MSGAGAQQPAATPTKSGIQTIPASALVLARHLPSDLGAAWRARLARGLLGAAGHNLVAGGLEGRQMESTEA